MRYTILDKTEKTVSCTYTGRKPRAYLTVPGKVEYNGETYQVKRFNSCSAAFYRVVFEEGVEEIGAWAFYQKCVREAVFPNTLKEIGDYAFRNTFLGDIILPDSLVHIGKGAFWLEQSWSKYLVKIQGRYYRGKLRLPKYYVNIEEKAFAITSCNTAAKSYACFQLLQVPQGTSLSDLHTWYIDKASDEMLKEVDPVVL